MKTTLKQLFTLLFLLFTFAYTYAQVNKLVINEVNISEPGIPSRQREYIEIFDGGIGNTAMDNMTLVMYDGETDLSYYILDLSTYTTNVDGYFLIGDQRVIGGVDIILPDDIVIRDKTGGIALYDSTITDFSIGMPVQTNNLLEAIVFEETGRFSDAIIASEELRSLLIEGEPQLNEDTMEIPRGSSASRSFQRFPNGSGEVRRTNTYRVLNPTPGKSNGGEEKTPIIGFTLVNGDTEQDVISITDGMTYPLNSENNDYLNIRVETDPRLALPFNSYVVRLNGPETFLRIENTAPYTLFGDKNGDYFGKTLPVGLYELETIPYTEPFGKGRAGIPVKVFFEITETEDSTVISSFSLLRRGSSRSVTQMFLKEGMQIKYKEGDSFALVANTLPNKVGSVLMTIEGSEMNEERLENVAPYAMFGDTNFFTYKTLTEGDYTISATPYTQALANGSAGTALTLNFTLELEPDSEFVLLQNPIQNSTLNLLLPGGALPGYEISFNIFNETGKYILSSSSYGLNRNDYVIRRGQERISINLSDRLTERGMYILQISAKGSFGDTSIDSTLRFTY